MPILIDKGAQYWPYEQTSKATPHYNEATQYNSPVYLSRHTCTSILTPAVLQNLGNVQPRYPSTKHIYMKWILLCCEENNKSQRKMDETANYRTKWGNPGPDPSSGLGLVCLSVCGSQKARGPWEWEGRDQKGGRGQRWNYWGWKDLGEIGENFKLNKLFLLCCFWSGILPQQQKLQQEQNHFPIRFKGMDSTGTQSPLLKGGSRPWGEATIIVLLNRHAVKLPSKYLCLHQ